jgi:DNA polymerase-3 subunit epsilon
MEMLPLISENTRGKKVVEVLEREPGYFSWLLNADFPRYTKKVLTAIRIETLNNA